MLFKSCNMPSVLPLYPCLRAVPSEIRAFARLNGFTPHNFHPTQFPSRTISIPHNIHILPRKSSLSCLIFVTYSLLSDNRSTSSPSHTAPPSHITVRSYQFKVAPQEQTHLQ